MTPSRIIPVIAPAPIVGESRQMRESIVCGIRMQTAAPKSEPPRRNSDVFRIDPETRRLREIIDELDVQLAYAFAKKLPTHVIEARIQNAETILRGKGAR